jgi:hypothetical protein
MELMLKEDLRPKVYEGRDLRVLNHEGKEEPNTRIKLN